jgi:hypothetical protein
MNKEIKPPSAAPVLADLVPMDPFEAWIANHGGGHPLLTAIIRRDLARARRMYASLFIPGSPDSGLRAALRVYRGVIILQNDGRVRSTEFFRIHDVDAFFALTTEEALAVLPGGSWDDKATLFSDARMDFRLDRTPSVFAAAPEQAANYIDTHIRFFEYFINESLRDTPELGDPLLETVPEDEECPVVANRPLKADVREALSAVLRDVTICETLVAQERFLACLDQDVLANMQMAGLNGCRWYNWLAGFSWMEGHMSAELGLRRKQASQAYPIAHCLLVQADHPVNVAMETAQPLIPALATALNVDPKIVKSMNGLTPKAAELAKAPDPQRLAEVVRKVQRLPQGGQKPSTEQDWSAFFASLAFADSIAHVITGGSYQTKGAANAPALADDMLASIGGKWREIDAPGLRQYAHAFPDMVNDLSATLIEPALIHFNRHNQNTWTTARLANLIVSNRSLIQVMDVCAWWHREQAAIHRNLAAAFPNRDLPPNFWQPIHLGGFKAANGLVVVALCDQFMLDEEHKRMGHCVNTYGARCLYDGSHVVSIRTADGTKSISTAELSQSALRDLIGKNKKELTPIIDRLPPGVIQHRGHENKDPSPQAKEALWEYISRVVNKSIAVDIENLEKSLAERRLSYGYGRDQGRSTAAYDYRNPQAIEAAWEAYSVAFPNKVRKRGLAELILGS